MANDTLSRVNRSRDAGKSGFRQRVNIPVLAAWLLLLAYGALVIWTASLTNEDASFSRQLLGMGLGAGLAFLCWRSDFSGLANLSTVLIVLDIIVLFSPYIPGLSYTGGLGMTGWDQDPAHRPDLPAG